MAILQSDVELALKEQERRIRDLEQRLARVEGERMSLMGNAVLRAADGLYAAIQADQRLRDEIGQPPGGDLVERVASLKRVVLNLVDQMERFKRNGEQHGGL